MFRLGAERFGVRLDSVREIRRPPRVTPLPEAPPWLRGVTNLRGTILAVVDVGVGLGIRDQVAATEGRAHRLVVMRDGDCDAGFCVDGVDGVLSFDEGACMTAPDTLPDLLRRWCDGIIGSGGELVTLLSPELLTGLRERLGARR